MADIATIRARCCGRPDGCVLCEIDGTPLDAAVLAERQAAAAETRPILDRLLAGATTDRVLRPRPTRGYEHPSLAPRPGQGEPPAPRRPRAIRGTFLGSAHRPGDQSVVIGSVVVNAGATRRGARRGIPIASRQRGMPR